MKKLSFRDMYIKVSLDKNHQDEQIDILSGFAGERVEETLGQFKYNRPQANLGVIFKNSNGDVTGVRIDGFASEESITDAITLLRENNFEYTIDNFAPKNSKRSGDSYANKWEQYNPTHRTNKTPEMALIAP